MCTKFGTRWTSKDSILHIVLVLRPYLSGLLRRHWHYSDVIMSTIASQIISLIIVYSTVYSGADQRKHQSSASLAFVRGIHRWPVNSPHKWPVTRKMFPFDDVIVAQSYGWPRDGNMGALVWVWWYKQTSRVRDVCAPDMSICQEGLNRLAHNKANKMTASWH